MSTILNFEKWNKLNEAQQDIDLLPKYGKQIQQKLLEGIKAKKPVISFYIDKYYFFTNEPNPIIYDGGPVGGPDATVIRGKFIDLTLPILPAFGAVPVIPNWDAGFGGSFEWTVGKVGQMVSVVYAPEEVTYAKTANDIIGHLKSTYALTNEQVILNLYNASPLKTQIDKAIADLKQKHSKEIAQFPETMKKVFKLT